MHSRMDSVGLAGRMRGRGALLAVALFAVVLFLAGTSWAQPDVNLAPAPVVDEASQGDTDSYVADVVGNDVYIRSGPGTNFYHCGKLYKGDRVQVVTTQQGWSCIVPPPGCFSWVAMQYVSINLDNPTMGIVTGNNVGVYAGSDYVLPMHSTSKQIVLNQGQKVKLLSEEKDDYYKIAPPDGAYLWVSTQFLQPAQSAVNTGPTAVEVPAAAEKPTETPETPVEVRGESELLDEYYALSKQVKEQLQKPISEQDYTELKEKLTKLAEDEAAGKAARYAAFTLKQVGRFELAATVAKEIALQKKELEATTSKIDEARAARLAQITDMGKFAVIGKLETSSVYVPTAAGGRRYRLLDESGKTICYVAPTGAVASKDLSGMIGHKVGLVGQIQPHEATARAFVEFTDIVPLD